MENFIKEHDYAILVYAKEDTAKYTAAIKALTETKKMSGWDRVQGVTIHKDCRIPSLYHEVVSIFKNMALCGLPVKKVWEKVREFLAKYTDELPDTDELDGDSTTGNVEEHRTQER